MVTPPLLFLKRDCEISSVTRFHTTRPLESKGSRHTGPPRSYLFEWKTRCKYLRQGHKSQCTRMGKLLACKIAGSGRISIYARLFALFLMLSVRYLLLGNSRTDSIYENQQISNPLLIDPFPMTEDHCFSLSTYSHFSRKF